MLTSYSRAQLALSQLKVAVYELLTRHPNGLSNAEIGKELGIYMGHIGHKGHIPRTILALLQSDDVVSQCLDTKRWTLKNH